MVRVETGNGSAEPLLALGPRGRGSTEVLLSLERTGRGDLEIGRCGMGSWMGTLLGLCIGSSNKGAGGAENTDVRSVSELVVALLALKVYWKDFCADIIPGVTGTRRAGVSMPSIELFVSFGGDPERERARVKTRPGVEGSKGFCVVVCGGKNEKDGNGGVTAAIASV